MRFIRVIILLLLALGLVSVSPADTVVLRSGRTLSGKLLSVDRYRVVLDTPDKGRVIALREHVRRLEKDGLLSRLSRKIRKPPRRTAGGN